MIHVHDEVGTLKRVLVHRPGAEIVKMTQFELERLLFDDILSLELAQREHDLLRSILGFGGAEVLEIQDVLTDALRRAAPDSTHGLLGHVCERAAVPELAAILSDWEPARLAAALIEGVSWSEVEERDPSSRALGRLCAELRGGGERALSPVPNLMFMRDPCISLYDRVMVGRMSTDARSRESILVHFALQFGLGADLLFDQHDWERHPHLRAIEGGDVLVLSPEQVMIGCSERTRPETVARVAEEVLFPSFPNLKRVHAVLMPKLRSVMHLDTILTAIDRTLFLGHAPMVSVPDALPVIELTRHRPAKQLKGMSVEDVLRAHLGHECRVVPCGGRDPLHQQREQWTDGANAVCLLSLIHI